ncbi:hypothetical protein Q5P01_000891, partial [Channa striata]
ESWLCVYLCSLRCTFQREGQGKNCSKWLSFGLRTTSPCILKLDMPIPNGPMARGQRISSSSDGLSTGKCSSGSLSSSKRPSKAPVW